MRMLVAPAQQAWMQEVLAAGKWLTSLLGDARLGPSIVIALAAAHAADSLPAPGVRDRDDGSKVRTAVARGVIDSDVIVALSIATDEFEACRQRGCQGWLDFVTILNLDPNARSKNSSQDLLTRTPGPTQPIDLESFLRPIARELNSSHRVFPV